MVLGREPGWVLLKEVHFPLAEMGRLLVLAWASWLVKKKNPPVKSCTGPGDLPDGSSTSEPVRLRHFNWSLVARTGSGKGHELLR